MGKPALLATLAVFVLAGCSETAQEKAQKNYFMCKNHVGHNCAQQNREEQNEAEAHEAETILKQRRAEELANAAEGR